MRSDLFLSDASRIISEPKTPSTPPSRLNGTLRQKKSQLETPPLPSPPVGPSSLLQNRNLESPASPTTLSRRPRKGSMIRQMAFSYGSPKIVKTQKPLDFRTAHGANKTPRNKLLSPDTTLNIDRELSILFEDSISSWLPLSPVSPLKKCVSANENERTIPEDVKDKSEQGDGKPETDEEDPFK